MPFVDTEMAPSVFREHMTTLMVPMEVTALVMIAFVFVASIHGGHYRDFPGSLFLWVLMVDFCYGLIAGVLRWWPDTSWYATWTYPATDTGCHITASVDSFFQVRMKK